MRIETTPRKIKDVHGGLVQPVIGQVVLLILGGLMLDGGFIAAVVLIGIITHWTTVAIISIRRRNTLTNGDVLLIRYGFLLFSSSAILFYLLTCFGWYLFTKQ